MEEIFKNFKRLIIITIRIEKKIQGDLDDAQEITAVWTYFRDTEVEQLFKFFFKEFEKGDNFIIVKIFCLISSHLF